MTDMCQNEGCGNCIANVKHIVFDCKCLHEGDSAIWEKFRGKCEKIIFEESGERQGFNLWFDTEKKEETITEDMKNHFQREEENERKVRAKRTREDTARRLDQERRQGKRRRVEEQPKKRKREEEDNQGNKRARMEKEKETGAEPVFMDLVEEVQETNEEIKRLDKVDQAAIHRNMASLQGIKLRAKATRERKVRGKKTMKGLTAKQMGNRGFVNKALKDQVNKKLPKEKKDRIYKRLLVELIRQIRENYRRFWDNHFDILRKDGIDVNKISRSRKSKNVTIT